MRLRIDDGFAVDGGPAAGRAPRATSASPRCFAVAKLIDASGKQQLIKIKNLSAGGLMAIVPNVPAGRRAGQRRAFVAEDPGDGRVDPRRHWSA